MRLDAEKRLREGWTPEIISGRARLEGRQWVCKETIYKHVCAMFSRMPKAACSRLTLDNGKEFAFHEALSQSTGLDVYFAHAYHAWERGTNENTNGLIRRLYPKGSSFAGIGEEELQRIERYVNDRPRKCLGWAPLREEMEVFLASAP